MRSDSAGPGRRQTASSGRRNTSTARLTVRAGLNQPARSVTGTVSLRWYSQPSTASVSRISSKAAATRSEPVFAPRRRFGFSGAPTTLYS